MQRISTASFFAPSAPGRFTRKNTLKDGYALSVIQYGLLIRNAVNIVRRNKELVFKICCVIFVAYIVGLITFLPLHPELFKWSSLGTILSTIVLVYSQAGGEDKPKNKNL